MPDIVDKTPNGDSSQFSATTPEASPASTLTRRLPPLVGDFSINFCRNPLCDLFGDHPYEFDRRGRPRKGQKPNIGFGKVVGSGKDRSFQCPSCNGYNILKSNIAIDEEYRRLRTKYMGTKPVHCPNAACENHDKPMVLNPDAYRKFGTTAKGDPRYQCKECKGTFSIGRANRRHKRKDLGTKVLRTLLNGATLSATARIQGVHIEDVYRKIDYIHSQALAFQVEREARLPECFSDKAPFIQTDTQTFKVNWSDKGVRMQADVRYTCTVHRPSGYVIAATTDVDPDILPEAYEALADQVGDHEKPRDMRKNARIWFPWEYVNFVRDRYAKTNLRNLPQEIGREDARLLLSSGRVHQDIADFAHVMLVKEKLGDSFRHLNVSVDRDGGLASAYCAVFKDEVKAGRVTIAEVAIDKNLSNQKRTALVAKGLSYRETVQQQIARDDWVSEIPQTIEPDERSMALPDAEMEYLISRKRKHTASDEFQNIAMKSGINYPFHFINEPNKRIIFYTDPLALNSKELAQFVVRAGTHYVDMYHARSRYKIQGFERGLAVPSGGNYYFKQYYDPVRVMKMADILCFVHNYMNLFTEGKDRSPAMRINIANGYVYDRDLAE